MQVTKEITFAYGHRLSDYQGKCRMLHGHNGKLSVSVERKELDSTGFIIDFGDLKVELEKISTIFDHKLILNKNDSLNQEIAKAVPEDWIVWFDQNPTAENIAQYIGSFLQKEIVCDLLTIKLWETDTSYVKYIINNTL